MTFLTKLGVSTRIQPAIYSVVHEESESEVQHVQILQESLKISISNIRFLFVNPIRVLEANEDNVKLSCSSLPCLVEGDGAWATRYDY